MRIKTLIFTVAVQVFFVAGALLLGEEVQWPVLQLPDFPDLPRLDLLQPADPSESGAQPIAPHQRADLTSDASQVVADNNRFAFDIYQRLLSQSDDNLLVSPFSISTALAMTYAGARGNTAQQMAGVLDFTLPADRLHAGFGEVLSDLTAPRDGYQLGVANRLFGQTGFHFQPTFLHTTANNYGAPLQPLDFHGAPEASRLTINQWVSDRTNAKIPDLLPGGSVTPDTRLVLTNAIYFNGKWKNKFDAAYTRNQSFFLTGRAAQPMPMMFEQSTLRYAEQPGFQMLELPYAGDDLAMVAMLPTERNGLASLEQSLTDELWKSSVAALHTTTVNVTLPKFTFDSSFKLNDVLKSMGMTDAFSNADFTGIAADGGLAISDVIHKAFIAIDEEGTEAAAATAVAITAASNYEPLIEPKTFLADHPFLFALEDLHSGSLLFLGRVSDPSTLLTTVPEPTSAVLTIFAGVGILGSGARNHRRKNQAKPS